MNGMVVTKVRMSASDWAASTPVTPRKRGRTSTIGAR